MATNDFDLADAIGKLKLNSSAIHKCTWLGCSYYASNLEELQQHAAKTHAGSVSKQSRKCLFTSGDSTITCNTEIKARKKFQGHMECHTRGYMACRFCSEGFATDEKLATHKKLCFKKGS